MTDPIYGTGASARQEHAPEAAVAMLVSIGDGLVRLVICSDCGALVEEARAGIHALVHRHQENSALALADLARVMEVIARRHLDLLEGKLAVATSSEPSFGNDQRPWNIWGDPLFAGSWSKRKRPDDAPTGTRSRWLPSSRRSASRVTLEET